MGPHVLCSGDDAATVHAETSGLAAQVMMYEREGRGLSSAFGRGFTHAAVSEPQPYERTPEEKAAGARTVADNIDEQVRLMRARIPSSLLPRHPRHPRLRRPS